MNIHYYWFIGEIIFIIFFFSFIFFNLRQKTKNRTTNIPETSKEKIKYFITYLFRIVGFGLSVFFVLSIIITIERSFLSIITETAPTPSQVNIPADLGFEVQEITFESEDGITLSGWFTPPQNNATIILLHGYGGNRTGMIWHAQQLTQHGYGVLMYDERASGESTGEYRSYGWEDTQDVKAAIQFLTSQNANENIGALGCSIGASIAVYSTALYPQIDAAWGDGNSSVRAQDLSTPKNIFMAFIIASNYLLDWMYTIKLNIDAPAPLSDVIQEIEPRPLMLVGGGIEHPIMGSEADLFTLRFYELAGSNAQVWVIPEATHCDGPFVIPDEYSKRMIQFFDEAFNITR